MTISESITPDVDVAQRQSIDLDDVAADLVEAARRFHLRDLRSNRSLLVDRGGSFWELGMP